MKKTDTERLKKIVSLWSALSGEITQHGITREMLLMDQFSQWAVTTPIYNIGEQVYQLSPEFKKKHADRQCNIYVHDMDVDMEIFKEDYENYDYLQKHLIAEVYFDTDEVLFNSEYRKI